MHHFYFYCVPLACKDVKKDIQVVFIPVESEPRIILNYFMTLRIYIRCIIVSNIENQLINGCWDESCCSDTILVPDLTILTTLCQRMETMIRVQLPENTWTAHNKTKEDLCYPTLHFNTTSTNLEGNDSILTFQSK